MSGQKTYSFSVLALPVFLLERHLKVVYTSCQKPKSVPNPCTYYSSCSHLCYKLYTQCEGKKEGSEHRDKLCSFPNAYCLLVIISLFVNNERINTIPDILYSGIVQITWYYTQCNASGVVACRLPGTIRCLGQTLYQSNI